MSREETASNNAGPRRGGNDEYLTDYVMVEAEVEETKRSDWSKGDSNKKTVIFIWDTSDDTTWLEKILRHESIVADFVPLSCAEDYVQGYEASSSLSVIFVHSVKSENRLSDLKSYLEACIKKIGLGKVNVVITDLQDLRSSLEIEKQWSNENYPGCQLMTLTHTEMDGIKNPMVEKKTDKMKALRQILLNAKGFQEMNHNQSKLRIGIFSRSAEEDYSWLMCLIKAENFKDLVEDIRPHIISNHKFEKFRNDVHQCTFAILYHSITRGRINVTNMKEGSLYDKELEYLHKHLGKNLIIVVIDDLDDSSDQMKTRILLEQNGIGKLARDLFLFSKEEKMSDYVRFLSSFQRKKKKLNAMMLIKGPEVVEDGMSRDPGQSVSHSTQHLPMNRNAAGNSAAKLANQTPSRPGPIPSLFSQINKKHVVGFFSSSSKEDYSWLVALANRHFKQVFSCYIGNSGFHHFMDDVKRCTFGILYHTMNRGRINITDVTDAIYDEHLKYMSARLGKDNVIVVVDDVMDSSDQEKRRILNSQPSIRRLARDLKLINKQEKVM